jgi:BA14K-like protein
MFDVPSSVSRERTICRPSLTRSPSNEGIVVNGNELLLGKTSLTMLPRRAAQSRNLPKQARFSGTTTDRSGFLLLRLPHADPPPAPGYPPPASAPAPGYPPPTPGYLPPAPEHGSPPGASAGDPVTYCTQRYRSYNPQTGTYLGNDGQRHHCP